MVAELYLFKRIPRVFYGNISYLFELLNLSYIGPCQNTRHVLMLQMEERPPGTQGSGKCIV